LLKITIKEVISLSLSNFIKDILNIQDDNISFPEKDFYQIIQKDNLLIKVFKKQHLDIQILVILKSTY
jgi:transposase